MPTLGWITLIGIIAIIVLVGVLRKQLSSDRIQEISEKRRVSSKLVGRADFVEGMQHIPVVLALTDSAFHYENEDLQAFIELNRIDEVEYDSELATGKDVEQGKVLRLRSHGHSFEFILDRGEADRWSAAFPPHRMGEPGSVRAS